MKTYEYHYVDENDQDVTEWVTEIDIIKMYWKYWYGKMVDKFGPDHPDITVENCIGDWVVVNWAVEFV
jgi:hypothetical protein